MGARKYWNEKMTPELLGWPFTTGVSTTLRSHMEGENGLQSVIVQNLQTGVCTCICDCMCVCAYTCMYVCI